MSWGLECVIHCSGSEPQGLGFGVCGLGVRRWGFGVGGSGLRIRGQSVGVQGSGFGELVSGVRVWVT